MSKEIEDALAKELDRLGSFLQKSYKAKVKWSRTDQWAKAIQAEIGSAIALGRLDLASNLMERHKRISFLSQQVSELEYAKRFSGEEPLPTEIPAPPNSPEIKDSTQS